MRDGDIFKSKKYGTIKVVRYLNARNVIIEFTETGYKTTAQSDKIKKGLVKDVMRPHLYGLGFYGAKNGELKNSRSAYDCWRHMLYRCYDERASVTHPTYAGFTICDDWLNFSNFYKWYAANYFDGCQIDKDINANDSKVYSPETCVMVTGMENNEKAQAKSYRVMQPNGDEVEVYNLARFCRENDLGHSNLAATYSGRRGHHKGYKITWKS